MSDGARARVRTGLDVLLASDGTVVRGARAGLLAHPASVTAGLEHAVDALIAHDGIDLVALFGPQHGVAGEKQDNMVESDHFRDERTGLPVHSLYSDVRRPSPEMLEGLDVLLIDLQDVGVRVYTFAQTMSLVMSACGEAGVRVVVLDRPNPIGGAREGSVLEPGYESFVGRHPVPLRHGLSMGELARLYVDAFGVSCELEVVSCAGWRRSAWFDDTGLPWVMPSPNLPTLESCVPYPGMVLLEGTNLSEGRGTTRPFELVGAPWLDPHVLARRLTDAGLPGVTFRACCFEPTFQKHAGAACGGVQLHVTDREAFQPVRAAVELLVASRELGGDSLQWNAPPYEYEVEKAPIDILWGGTGLREGVDAGRTAADILADGAPGLAEFDRLAAGARLYD